jgi:copper chaperone CopZ
MRHLTLHITGMTCGHCMHAVNQSLVAHPGVRLESLRMGRAELQYDEEVTTPSAIEAAVAEAGYTATATTSAEAGERS